MSRKHGTKHRSKYLIDCCRSLGLPLDGTTRHMLAKAIASARRISVPISREDQWALIYSYWQDDVPLVVRYQRTQRKPSNRRKHKFPNTGVNSEKFLSSFEWRRLRMEVLTERGARCECCGATPKDGIVIHVDHIKPRWRYPELALTKANLQVLCEVCNHGKGSWNETDWRALAPDSEREMDTPVSRSGDGDGHQPITAGAATFRELKSPSRPKLVREQVAR